MTEPSLTPPPGSTVLLYSGGLDSYILAALYKPDVLLHVNLEGRYGATETDMLERPAGAPRVTYVDLPLGFLEDRESLILPGRNAVLALVASSYGDRVWLGATAGDRTRDKDPEFARLMTELFAHIYGEQWWLPAGRHVSVELPIKDFTKRELVRLYLNAGLDRDALVHETFSCYAPNAFGEACAACKPCIRKWVALVVNGYTADELEVDASAATQASLDEGGFEGRGTELADVLEALDRTRV